MAMAMLTRNLSSFFFSNIFFFLIVSARKSGDKIHGKALFIFGDSFFDAGNNNYINTTTLDQANFWPYGQTFFGFPTGRFSDGRLISDFIAEYAKLPMIPPFLQPGNSRKYDYGVNFASAGAGALVQTFKGSVINMKTQLENYKRVEKLWKRRLGEEKAKKRMEKAVYLISIGTNDYLSPLLATSSSTSQLVHLVIANLASFVQEIYKIGGRKFGFLNVPDLGCLPVIRVLKPESNGSCVEEASLLARMHNEALSKLLSQLEGQLQGFKYSLFDMNLSVRIRMAHPSKFGFKEGEEACCGTGKLRGIFSCGGKRSVKEFKVCDDPNDYIFWDSIHFTENTYNQIALSFWNGGSHHHHHHHHHHGSPLLVAPYNIKTLFHAP